MLTRRVRCTKCGFPLAPGGYNSGTLQACRGCRARTLVEVFAVLTEPPRIGQRAEAVDTEGQAGCYFHPAKKAQVPCDHCGRFLCSVCDIELGESHLCPACLQSAKARNSLKQLQTSQVLYDSLALALAVYPLPVFPVTCITAPMVIYLVIRGWNAPAGLFPRRKWRFIVALLIALAELSGWVVYLVSQLL